MTDRSTIDRPAPEHPKSLDQLQTPALLVRLDRVRANLEHMLALLGGRPDRWRPHIKTSKIPAVIDLLLDVGVRHFKCATTKEARMLLGRARQPIDLLVAYPHRGPNLRRIADLAGAHPEHAVGILSEDPAHADTIRRDAPAVHIHVDLDPGDHRTGIPLQNRARIRATMAAAGAALRGLHYYEGHASDPAHDPDPEALFAPLLTLLDELARDDLELVTSGTPCFEAALACEPLRAREHRVSPGTIVYSDLRTEEVGVTGFSRAVHVLSTVVSAPLADRITCDAGSKAIDAAIGDPCAAVEGWPELVALTPSEEHLPLRARSGPVPDPGTRVQLVPRHVCPTVNLADDAVLLEGDRILGVVPVAARGHETP